ncbi:MAG TPA: hypothetical protein VEH76_02430 [Methylocystis sp.]|nr:hypothetical protein [Methylocystis sp.]
MLALAGTTTALFAIPIAFAPLRWARLMLWRLPEDTDLALYFGRCLGAIALMLEILAIRAGLTGEGLKFVFEFMMLTFATMVVIHVVGALQRVQPVTETLEIGLWLVFIAATAAFWPSR